MVNSLERGSGLRVLHVIVGHGLPIYYLNSIRSVRATASADPLLVIDNASSNADLRANLRLIADKDDRIHLVLRSTNDTHVNGRVGSLYSAYEIAFAWAIDRGFDMLHLMQSDMQMLWWDAEVVQKSAEIFSAHSQCVNIHTLFLTRDTALTDGLIPSAVDGLPSLKKYGLTDTGIYHLGRWREGGMHFGPSEQWHAKYYRDAGLEVLWHPWPTDAQIPWPAVIRNGSQQGKEVTAGKPYLLKPLPEGEVVRLKAHPSQMWLEDVCVPWGWVCVTPMWTTDLNSIDYWVMRYRDAKAHGLSRVVPRLECRGVDARDRSKFVRIYRCRPSLTRLFVFTPIREMIRRLAHRR